MELREAINDFLSSNNIHVMTWTHQGQTFSLKELLENKAPAALPPERLKAEPPASNLVVESPVVTSLKSQLSEALEKLEGNEGFLTAVNELLAEIGASDPIAALARIANVTVLLGKLGNAATANDAVTFLDRLNDDAKKLGIELSELKAAAPKKLTGQVFHDVYEAVSKKFSEGTTPTEEEFDQLVAEALNAAIG